MPRCANRSSKAADRLLYGAVSAFAILHANPAFCADDPFELKPGSGDPAGSTDNGRLIVEVVLNGETKKRLVELRSTPAGLLIRAGDAVYLGLVVKAAGDAFVPLSGISGIRFSYDPTLVRLEIEQTRKADGPNLVDFAARKQQVDDSKPLTALVVDYDAIVRADDRGISAAALGNVRLSRDNWSLESGWQLNSRPLPGISKAVRLDSALTLVLENRGLKAVLGDFIAPSSANRSVRLAGFQIGTDFSTRPDVVTYPLPELGGSVGLPSALDIVVNDRRISSAPVEAGDYAVRNVPVSVGRNQVGVIVKNALGVEEVRTVQFYTSSAMLARGISQSSGSLGFVRRRYGFKSNDYGKLAFSAAHRRGITDRLTAEASVEVARHFYNVGAASVFTLGDLGAVKLGLNHSSLTPGGIASRKGNMLTAGLESVGGPVSATIEARLASPGYGDLASASGDPPPFSRIAASLNFDLKTFGQVQLSAIRQFRQKRRADGSHYRDEISNYLALSYRTTVRSGMNLFADLTVDPARRKSAALLLGLSVQFGKRTNGQASLNRQRQGADYQIGIQRPDILPGDIGYFASASTGFVDRAAGGVSYRGHWGRVEARTETVGNRTVGSMGAQGALVFAEGSVFAANRTGEAFAIVRTGKVGDVTVMRDNRPVGLTRQNGVVLVTDLPAYVPVKIAIDADTAPADSVIVKDSAVVRSGARSGRLVELSVKNVVAGTVQLLDFDDQPVPPGTMLTALPSKTSLIAGFDGIVEFDQALNDSELELASANGDRCYAAIPAGIGKQAYAHLGSTRCTQRVRQVDLAALGIAVPQKQRPMQKRKSPTRTMTLPDRKGVPHQIRHTPPSRRHDVLARELRLFSR
jgi:outer membrane usher protein